MVTEWAMLAYRTTREPSNPRVVIWRKLRRLGAIHLVDGLAVLPADARTRERFAWLAEEVFGFPFLLAGGIKASYELVLWRWFREVTLPDDAVDVALGRPEADASSPRAAPDPKDWRP